MCEIRRSPFAGEQDLQWTDGAQRAADATFETAEYMIEKQEQPAYRQAQQRGDGNFSELERLNKSIGIGRGHRCNS